MNRQFAFAVLAAALLSVPARAGGPATQSPPAAYVASCEAQQTLDEMDGRAPVPLLPRMAHHQKTNMRDHLAAVQQIVAALGEEDFAAAEAAARRIGTSDEMTRMCTHMGAGAVGFTDQAMNFHRTADTIAAAAREKDKAGVAKALSATLQTCVACHASYRQQVVDEATWTSITSMPPPGPPAGRGPGGWGRKAGRGPGGQ